MNRNHLLSFCVVIAILALAAFTMWRLFEIHPTIRYVYPSDESMSNEYLAFDRWLENSNIPVRIAGHGDHRMISRAEEKHIFIQASLFQWSEEAVDFLAGWVDRGGYLYFYLDDIYNRETISLLGTFGISISEPYSQAFSNSWSEEYPNFDRRFSFELSSQKNEDILFLDWNDQIRLVQVKHGSGTFIVSGQPRYLNNFNISREPNARLAWGLFAHNGSENSGWLFIRGNTWYQNQSILGSLFRHGNFTPLLVSILVLLLAGFWAVIPIFGLVREDRETPGKAIRERFLAEGRFLKNFRALDTYRELYVREIRRKLAGQGSAIYTAKIEEELNSLLKKPERPGDYDETIGNLKNILERL